MVVHVCLRKYRLQWLCRLVATSCQFVGRCSTASTLCSFTSAFRSAEACVQPKYPPKSISQVCLTRPTSMSSRVFSKSIQKKCVKRVVQECLKKSSTAHSTTEVSHESVLLIFFPYSEKLSFMSFLHVRHRISARKAMCVVMGWKR